MPELTWYRSLYWRIALGFVALVAVLLAVQGLIFLWLTGRTTEFLPGRSPIEYAQTIATDLTLSLSEDPGLDLDTYLNQRYSGTYRPFVVVTRDNRTIVSRRIPPAPGLVRTAYARLTNPAGPGSASPNRSGAPSSDPGSQVTPGRGREGFRGFGRGRGGLAGGAGVEFAPVVVNDQTFAIVAVPVAPPPLSAALRDLGPTLAIVAIALLSIGITAAALMIFRPTHRRLKSLQDAARAIGTGQSGARATETGGDEGALLARTFNEMAGGLEQRTQALMAADRARRQLLADVSHELMTPLAAIRGYVETMTMPDLNISEATRGRYLQIVADETVRLEHIIGDLLDLARVEGGGGTWKSEAVPVAAIFERVQQRHQPLLDEKVLTLDRSIAPGADTVWGDPNRLEQALQNLAANAIRHTPAGGTVRLSATPMAGGILMTVEDTGPGIPDEHLARVFDRFYKVDVSRTGTPSPSGSGLGLSIVHAIVTRHGGQVTASNRLQGGARFEIFLPHPTA